MQTPVLLEIKPPAKVTQIKCVNMCVFICMYVCMYERYVTCIVVFEDAHCFEHTAQLCLGLRGTRSQEPLTLS